MSHRRRHMQKGNKDKNEKKEKRIKWNFLELEKGCEANPKPNKR